MISRVTLILNGDCNANCHYCYEKHVFSEQQLKISTIKKFVSILDKNFQLDPGCTLEILGGEPALYKHWSELVSLLNELNFKNIVIFTNGINYIPELKLLDHKNRNIRVKIAKNNSNTYVVDQYCRDEICVDEYFIVTKLNIDDMPQDSNLVLCEYIGDENIDLDYDDVYKISYSKLIKNGITKEPDLLYLSKMILGDMWFQKRNTCLPYVEEIAIRYDDLIVPCSRCSHLDIGIHIDSENIVNKIQHDAEELVNINVVGLTESGNDCFSCPLKYTCHPCLMIKCDTVYTNNGLVHSSKKCEHEMSVYRAQYDAWNDYKKIMKGN